MTHAHFSLAPRAPFWNLTAESTANHGVIVSDRDGLGIAVVLVRKGREAELAQRMRQHFRVELPGGPRRTAEGGFAIAGLGPGAWLATDERYGNALAVRLQEVIGDVASIADQSDGYAVLRLEGSKVRAVLEKMLPIDLHPRVFKSGDVAVSAAGHVGATLWRIEDRANGVPVFELAVFRSMAADLGRLLSGSAAEFGLVFEREPMT